MITVGHALIQLKKKGQRTEYAMILSRLGVRVSDPIDVITPKILADFALERRVGLVGWREFRSACVKLNPSLDAIYPLKSNKNHVHVPVDPWVTRGGIQKAYCATCKEMISFRKKDQVWQKNWSIPEYLK